MLPMPRYTEIEHTADIGVEVYGPTLEELFINAGYALFDTIADADTIETTATRTVTVEGGDIETLFMNWLRELLYLFSVEQEVYSTFRVHITEQQDPSSTLSLEAAIMGEPLDFSKHRFETEIKAITYHQFTVEQHHDEWHATVIFDV